MIFADKLLDLRKRQGWSQEELADKLQVSRQSVSKWESAQSVPDLNRIIEISEIFGVSTDYLLKDEVDLQEVEPSEDNYSSARRVSLEEANEFLRLKEESATPISIGVMFFILTPLILLILIGLSEVSLLPFSENMAVALGLVGLFVFIAIGLYFCLKEATKLEDYKFLEEDAFETAYGVTGMVRERKERFRDTHKQQITLGLLIITLGVLPIILTALLFDNHLYEDLYVLLGVCGTLLFISQGVRLLIKASIPMDSYNMLLEEGDYTMKNKRANKRLGIVSPIYWLLVTAIFLAYSFITNGWDHSWIFWPIAGVLYAIVAMVASATGKKEE